MKAVTVYQPWAELIARNYKHFETRSWSTSYRGPLAIQAGLNTKFIRYGQESIIEKEPFRSHLMQEKYGHQFYPDFRLGMIVATCELIACIQITSTQTRYSLKSMLGKYSDEEIILPPEELERSFGDYTPGRYAWILHNIKPVDNLTPVRGGQGLWEFPAEKLGL